MANKKIFIFVLGIFVLLLIIVGLMLAGSPISQQALKYDEIRLRNFSSISYEITNFSIADPETKRIYDYQKFSPNSYKLCTVFSTDSKSANSQYSYINSSSIKKHKKGYDCVIYNL